MGGAKEKEVEIFSCELGLFANAIYNLIQPHPTLIPQ
jgi:hypothetical protein